MPVTIVMEDYAIFKKPARGKCPNSPFSNGWHRVGSIPVLSLLDGGLAGDVLQDICLHCGKVLKRSGFVIRKQRNKLSV